MKKKLLAGLATGLFLFGMVGITHAVMIGQANNDQNVKEKVKPPTDDDAKFKRDLVFSNDLIRVYSRPPHISTVMGKTLESFSGFDIEYDFEHADRGKYLSSQYLAQILFPLARKHSGRLLSREDTVTVYYYKNGETHHWDSVDYYFPVQDWNGKTAKYAEIKHHYLGEAAEKQQNKSDSSYLGECAVKGPFCDLPGGKYLNAIYRNDTRTLDAMDSKYALRTDSLLVHIANQYMYDYDRKTYTGYFLNTAAECFESGARTKTFSMTTDVVNYKTLSGLDAGSVGGDRVASTYTVNAEFYPLLLKIGSHLGGNIEEVIAQNLNLKGMNMALKGAKQLQIKYSCKSNEVKQFEKNLISLTDRFLKKKNYSR
ncbi:MAG: hypothetical protein KKC76_12885 [Proteobacteria bacterium]|nr:hypothetical protein [Pseudomonadota bacterium]MBU4294991.1 hypothetical protein [Pseudomonadota bacterium]MCG2746657.1 hypothetical protein [Desulfobulbaceae bacterium]